MRIFAVGCTHLDDDRILMFRPNFQSLRQMNDYIVQRWNSVVGEDDVVYVLGDFAVRQVQYWNSVLHGHKTLILGNHDPQSVHKAGFVEVCHVKTIHVPGRESVGLRDTRQFWLSHYPCEAWPGKDDQRQVVHLHAHSHGNLKSKRRRCDVSIDAMPQKWPLELKCH